MPSAPFVVSFDDHEVVNNWAGDHDAKRMRRRSCSCCAAPPRSRRGTSTCRCAARRCRADRTCWPIARLRVRRSRRRRTCSTRGSTAQPRRAATGSGELRRGRRSRPHHARRGAGALALPTAARRERHAGTCSPSRCCSRALDFSQFGWRDVEGAQHATRRLGRRHRGARRACSACCARAALANPVDAQRRRAYGMALTCRIPGQRRLLDPPWCAPRPAISPDVTGETRRKCAAIADVLQDPRCARSR